MATDPSIHPSSASESPLAAIFGPAAPLAPLGPDAAGRTGPVAAVPVSEGELLAWGATGLFAWGVFNPYGPTLSFLGTVPSDTGGTDLLWFRTLNPFHQAGWLIGTLAGDDRAGAGLARHLVQVMNGNVVAAASGELVRLQTCPPDWVMWISDDPAVNKAVCWCISGSPEVAEADLAGRIAQILRHWRRPWDRAAEERDRAWAPVREAVRTGAGPRDHATRSLLEAWWRLISRRDHMVPELVAFPEAWVGAIRFQADAGNEALARSAYPMAQVEWFADQVGMPIFRQIRERALTSDEVRPDDLDV
jgi:hypothetical protein